MFKLNTTVKDRIGQRVGRLLVLARAASQPEKDSIRACWLCQCDCGNTIIVTGASLNKGAQGKGGTRSCGCLMKEKPIKHGRCSTRAYRIWNTMFQRSTNPNNPAYHRYGGRGITVCEEWKDFRNFYADMGNPSPGLTLDRKDNSLGYSKDNCRWATRMEQSNNRENNRCIEYQGKQQTAAQWAREFGLTKNCLMGRLNKDWPIERALLTPSIKNRRFKKGD